MAKTRIQEIPKTKQVVELSSYGDNYEETMQIVEKKLSEPGKGQVIVKMSAAPINPSDLMFVRGLYGVRKELPVVPGFEGSGVVIASGKDFASRSFLGRRVACSAPDDGDGTWSDYMLTNVERCIPLKKYVTDEQGATMIVNPLTAWGLMEPAIHGRHKAVVQTAAASALGKMVIRLGQRFSVPTINIVRRQEQVDLLKSMSAEHVLNSSDNDFAEKLKDLCHRLKATLAFDAIAGEMTACLAQAMPKNSIIDVYGGLSEQPCQIHPGSLIFGAKTIRGFWLSKWMSGKSLLGKIKASSTVQKMLADELKTEIREKILLADCHKALDMYQKNMTQGKILLYSE